jgi:hypothetical protein
VYGEGVIELVEKGVDSTEYSVGGFALAPVISPCFDDSNVVAVHPKMSASTSKPWDGPDEELKPNSFGSANVSGSFLCLPARYEPPGSPFSVNGDGDAREACI